MNVLDLFSGIGGFSLGLERAGMRTVAFCEIDPFCRRVLARHWPEVPCYDDIRTLSAYRLRADGISINAICGGFPCQDISLAGNGAGLEGERSGLWREYARIIGELRPDFVIVENVAALLARGLDRVLADLAALGYDAEWHCIPAFAVGAPHRRDRVWIIAYARSEQHEGGRPSIGGKIATELSKATMAYADRGRGSAWKQAAEAMGHGDSVSPDGGDVSDANSPRLPIAWSQSSGENGKQGWRMPSAGDWWAAEPDVGRVAHGIPGRVDRLRQLGNSVVPQIPEIIGIAIMSSLMPRDHRKVEP